MGSKLKTLFTLQGHEVQALGRKHFALSQDELSGTLKGATAVIHLAGESIAKRWTRTHRQKIYDSRISTTRKLVDAMLDMEYPPAVFISASAKDIYPAEGVYDESAETFADTFLGRVCRDWEAEALRASTRCRTLLFRFALVMGKDGGALKAMLPVFRWGFGGKIGSGKQKMPWIHIDDVMAAFQLALKQEQISGPVNIVAPGLVTNKEFTKTLAGVLNRPAVFTLPTPLLTLVLGKQANLLTRGQSVIPGKLRRHDFEFRFPKLEGALQELLR